MEHLTWPDAIAVCFGAISFAAVMIACIWFALKS